MNIKHREHAGKAQGSKGFVVLRNTENTGKTRKALRENTGRTQEKHMDHGKHGEHRDKRGIVQGKRIKGQELYKF